jgi:hypothetical protein
MLLEEEAHRRSLNADFSPYREVQIDRDAGIRGATAETLARAQPAELPDFAF